MGDSGEADGFSRLEDKDNRDWNSPDRKVHFQEKRIRILGDW